MRTKPSFQWPHKSAPLLIAGTVTMLATGCVCLFSCPYNSPPWDCKIPDGYSGCRDGLHIQLVDKKNPTPLENYKGGVEKGFQIFIHPDNKETIEIACNSKDAENTQYPHAICYFSSSDKVSAVFIEGLTASNISITFERENYSEVFADLPISYSTGSIERCEKPELVCRVSNLTLEVE